MTIADIEKILAETPSIKSDRNYWLVRTQGGLYYDNFRDKNFIAIGANEISLSDISDSRKNEKKPNDLLTQRIKKLLKDEKQPGYLAGQLMKFTYSIKKNDIVLIPSVSSSLISIGEVAETPVTLANNVQTKDPKVCPYVKRKKVRWLKDVYRDNLDPTLYKMLFSHHIISDANQYAQLIDNSINNFYVKHDEASVILDVTSRQKINARELFKMGDNLLDTVDEFCKFYNLDIDTSDVEIKLNLQSPGKIQLTGKQKAAILVIGMFVIGTVGGGFKINYGDFHLDLSTNGLIQKVIDYQNSSHDREVKNELMQKHMKDFQIKQPDDLVKVFKQNSTNKSDPK